jgi:hypothetical protein
MGRLIALWAVIGGAWALSGFLLHGQTDRGTFGDMFGAVNALFTGLAFATLIYTAWMQREELALQRQELAATRAELEGQRLQLVQQSATFALQQFEDSFFALLRVHGEIVNAMDLVNEEGQATRSRDCFAVWYRRLKNVHAKQAVYPEGKALETVQTVYGAFYNKHQSELGHYFRHLYHIIKFVKEAPIQNKRKYTSLVRAQLSAYEHLMLFYNGLSTYGYTKFKPLIEEFELLENMPQQMVISPQLHLPLYAPSAYGQDNAV